MTDNEIIKAQKLIKKLEEAYNAYYDTSKGMPYDIDKTLRETAICLENSLAEINRQKAEISVKKKLLDKAVEAEDKARAEAYKEVWGELRSMCDEPHWCVWLSEIDDFFELKTKEKNDE